MCLCLSVSVSLSLSLCVFTFMFFVVVLVLRISSTNRRFPEITGEDNLTVFSYSVRVTSPEWRRQRRRADLRHFEIFSHGPIIIYTRYQLGEPNYPICTFPASSECLIGISDAFSAFCLRVSVVLPTFSLYPQQKRAYSALHPQAWTFIQVHTRRHLPSAVPWISEDRQLTPVLLSVNQYGYN